MSSVCTLEANPEKIYAYDEGDGEEGTHNSFPPPGDRAFGRENDTSPPLIKFSVEPGQFCYQVHSLGTYG